MATRSRPRVWSLLVGSCLVAGAASACGSSSPGAAADGGGAGGDAGNPGSLAPGTGSLSGGSAFPVKWAWMNTYSPSTNCPGLDASAPPGAIDAVAILLFEDDLSSQACSDAGLASGTGHAIDLEIATPSYETGASPFTALGPGTYAIGDEGEDDPDVCMLAAGSSAYLAVIDFGLQEAQNLAASGSVTITSIDATDVVGSFQVVLGDPYGRTDGGSQTLSGSFHAVTCP